LKKVESSSPAALPREGVIQKSFLQHPSIGNEDPLRINLILLIYKYLIFVLDICIFDLPEACQNNENTGL
jgi:hypothetical protein